MSSFQPLLLNPSDGPAFSAVGDNYRLLASGDQTGGVFALLEAKVPPGGGPPPHIHHREDETFYVLEGEITFRVGDCHVVGRAGSYVQGPRGVPHAFKNEGSAPARMLVLTSPPGFEDFMREFAHPLPSIDLPPVPVTPADIERLLALAPKYGIEILPAPQP